MSRLASVLALAAGCGDGAPDPCAGLAGACVEVHVSSSTIETIEAIDQLELDVLFGDRHGTTTTQPEGGGTVALPLVTAIELELTATVDIGVVAAGKLGGVVLGTGAATTPLAPGARTTIDIVLAPPASCDAGGFYCGGDKLAGDAQTLYQCNGGGVPLARGRCTYGCTIRPSADDVCDGGPMTCIEGGFYCGGNELAGDPRTRYRCVSGVATSPMPCANGCVIAPAGTDDFCR